MKIYRYFFFLILIVSSSHAQNKLSLEEAIKISLQNNYQINIAENQKEIAENNFSLGNSGFLPNLNASGTYSKSINNTTQEYLDGRLVDRTGAKSDNLSAGISLEWTIFDGLAMFTTLNQIKELRKIGEQNYKAIIEDNVSEVIFIYYQLVRQKEVLEVIDQNIRISKERVRIAEDKLNVGSGSRFELRQAQVDLNEDQSSFLREELTLAQLKTSLNQLLGRNIDENFSTEDTIIVKESLELDPLYEAALKNNKDLKIAETNKTLSELDISLYRSEWFPEISLFGGYNYVKAESEAGFVASNLNKGFTYGVTASINLFNGLQTNRRIENAKISLENSEIRLNEITNSINANLKNTFLRYKNSLVLIELERSNLRAAEENLDVALERLKLGNITQLEFRETQRQLINAKSRLFSALYEAKSAETELLRLSGRLIE